MGLYHSAAGLRYLQALVVLGAIAEQNPSSVHVKLLEAMAASFLLACPLNGSPTVDKLTCSFFKMLHLDKLLLSATTRRLTTDNPELTVMTPL